MQSILRPASPPGVVRWLALVLLVLVGCGGGSGWANADSGATYRSEPARDRDYDGVADEVDLAEAAPPMEPSGGLAQPQFRPELAKLPADKQKPEPGQAGQAAQDPSRSQPILIYRADFTLSVYEVQKSLDAVDALARDHGGYLARRDDRSITVRVPAEKFEALVGAVEKVGDVLHRDVSSEDVTAEYRDLEVQLKNQLALRDRFEKLLEKATKVEEALAIEKELGRITGEIERVKGRLKLLSDLARYSTLSVRFQPRSQQQLQQGPFVLPLPWLDRVGLKRLTSL